MIVGFGLLLCAALAVAGWKKEKSVVNPLTTFGAVWFVVLLCSLTFPRFTKPKDDIYVYDICGILAFGLGYLLSAIRKKRKKFKIGKHKLFGYASCSVPRRNALYVVCVICILASMYDLYLIVSHTGSLASAAIKAYLQTFTMQKSSWLNAFYFLLTEPLSIAVPVIAISNYVYGNKDKKLLILSVILVIVRSITKSTRNSLLMVLVYFFVGAVEYIRINGKGAKLKRFAKKKKKQLILTAILGIVLFVYMTIARGLKITENLWIDFALPPRLFEIWKEEVDSQKIVGYGFASLQGFIFPIFYVLKNIFKIPLPHNIEIINDLITRTDTVFVWPGERITANAYVSCFWFLYLDGRIWGIIIGAFLLGVFTSQMYKELRYNSSEKVFTMYCFVFNFVVFSMVRVQFTSVSFALGMLYALLLYQRKSVRGSGRWKLRPEREK